MIRKKLFLAVRRVVQMLAMLLLISGAAFACSITNTTPLPNAPLTVVYPSMDSPTPWVRLTTDGTCGTVTGWSISSGSLPAGLAITEDVAHATWYVTGTPTGSLGNSSFTLSVTGSSGSATQATSIQVVQANPSFSPALAGFPTTYQGTFAADYGQFTSPQTVSLSATGGAKVCYTLNYQNTNTEPTTDGAGHCTGGTLDYSVTGPFVISQPELVRAVATKAGSTDSNIAPGFYDIMVPGDPALPQNWISSTINSTNFPCLFASPVMKTVKASGGSYTTLAAALAAIPTDTARGTQCEILTVDAESTGFQTTLPPGGSGLITYQQAMAPGNYVWIRPSGYALLPAQGSNTRSCTAPDGNVYGCAVNHTDRTNMWKVLKQVTTGNAYNYDGAFYICGNTLCSGLTAASGLILTGMDFQYYGQSGPPYSYMFNAIQIGDTTNTVAPSNIYFDRDSFDTQSGNFDVYLKSDIAVLACATCSVTDSFFDHEWEPAAQLGQSWQGQDYLQYGGPGPVKLVNNWFAGTSVETVMFGGATSPATIGWAHDIEIRRNIFTKNPSVILDPNYSGIGTAGVGAAGTGYTTGDVLTVVHSGGSGGTVTVASVGGSGNVTSYTINTPGTGYPLGNGYATTGGHGTGATVNVSNCPGTNAGLANLLEFGKDGAQNALIEGNILLYSYSAPNGGCYQQGGNAMAIKMDQDYANGATRALSTVTDVTVRYNDVGHFAIPFEIIGGDQHGREYGVMQRVAIHDNRFFDASRSIYSGPGSTIYGIIVDSGGGKPSDNAVVSVRPGPWFVKIYNNAIYGTTGNATGLTYIDNPNGCSTPGTVWPYLSFLNNVAVTDGPTGTVAGHEILNGDCANSPYTLFADGVFPNMNWGNGTVGSGTGNMLFNFKASSGSTCDLGTTSGGWGGVNPGMCPPGLASSPSTINSTAGMADYASCAAGTGAGGRPGGSLSACLISGTYSGVGPNYSAMSAAMALSNDYYSGGGLPSTLRTSPQNVSFGSNSGLR